MDNRSDAEIQTIVKSAVSDALKDLCVLPDTHCKHHAMLEPLHEVFASDPHKVARMSKFIDESLQAHEDKQAMRRVLGRFGLKPALLTRTFFGLITLVLLYTIYGNWHKAVEAAVKLLPGG